MEKKVKNIFIQGAIPAEKVATSIQSHGVKTNIGAHSIFLGQVRVAKPRPSFWLSRKTAKQFWFQTFTNRHASRQKWRVSLTP